MGVSLATIKTLTQKIPVMSRAPMTDSYETQKSDNTFKNIRNPGGHCAKNVQKVRSATVYLQAACSQLCAAAQYMGQGALKYT
jgi:hypothetical protein